MTANLIELLREYGNSIDGFLERVGGDFARGHTEATGGIIPKVRALDYHADKQSDFALLLQAMGVSSGVSPTKPKVKEQVQAKSIKDFFGPA
jgi:hypothetical protein